MVLTAADGAVHRRYFRAMPVELRAEIEHVAGQPAIPECWRGVVDFGEVWGRADEDLWPPNTGPLPEGEPLTYGCEVMHSPESDNGVRIRIFFLDAPRKVMVPGAALTLRDGRTARANGKLL
jgi:hypothetical protein